MNLQDYQRWYVKDEGHWYVSKVKQYNPASIQEFARIMNLLVRIFSLDADPDILKRFHAFKPKRNVMFLFEDKQIPIDDVSTLYASILFIKADMVNLAHLRKVNPKKFKKFNDIEKEFIQGEGYDFFVNKYTLKWLVSDLTIYYRNFKSWLGKFGFWGEYPHKLCYITDIGLEFANNYQSLEISCAIFKHQLKRFQIHNPTVDAKYSDYKIKPYFLLQEVISQLPDNYFTKDEYILFIIKVKSHSSLEISNAVQRIKQFRKLSPEQKKLYIDEIILLDKKLFRDRARTNFERFKDSANKELDLFTFGDTITKGAGEYQGCYILNNPEKLREELTLFSTTVKFIEFKDKLDWITYLGGMKKITLDEIVEMYLRDGKSTEEISAALRSVTSEVNEMISDKLYEKQIEDYYVANIKDIHPNLEVITEPTHGRQFKTHIGPIDILCRDKKTQEYVVIELKRGQASDETVGQVLRYMGWVFVHMAKSKKDVRGILVGREFSESVKFSLIGIQRMNDLINTFNHPFDETNPPPKKQIPTAAIKNGKKKRRDIA